MEYIKIALLVLISFFSIIILVISIMSKKPLRTLIFNAFLGVIILAIINLTSNFTNVTIPINNYTVYGSCIFGIPSLIIFLLLNIII